MAIDVHELLSSTYVFLIKQKTFISYEISKLHTIISSTIETHDKEAMSFQSFNEGVQKTITNSQYSNLINNLFSEKKTRRKTLES